MNLIAHLNNIPQSLLVKARTLSDPGDIEVFLSEYTEPETWDYLPLFIEEVVLNGQPAEQWMRGQVVVPDFSLVEQLCLRRSALLEPLGGAFDQRVVPSMEDFRCNVSWVGAPALLVPIADYRYEAPDHAVGVGVVPTEATAEPDVVLRRWIAVRLALVLRPGADLDDINQLAAKYEDIPSTEYWSDDARIAARGLIVELRELAGQASHIPGTGGADEWYTR